MRYVGFAILLRIMLSKDLWGIYFAGFALATIVGSIEGLGGPALLIIAFIGIGIAIYDFQTNVKMKANVSFVSEGGDDEDGI
ncbi:MAG: PTS sugar transporter subunit IIC, partial [Clostridium sp.]